MTQTTYSAPPAFLAGIPDKLLLRGRPDRELQRSHDLVRYCDEHGYHPTFLDLERERARR